MENCCAERQFYPMIRTIIDHAPDITAQSWKSKILLKLIPILFIMPSRRFDMPFSIQIATPDSDRNSATIRRNARATKRGEERRGESGNERLRIRRNYTAKLHGAINPCALIVTSLRNRKLSAIDGNHRASSGRNETVAETSP